MSPKTKKTCLVVEDSKVIREIAMRILTDLGLDAHEVDNAEAGVAFCREHKPDAVLLDWDLPSMAALDFLRGAGELPPEEKPEIVLCSTENDHQQFTLARAAGAAHHILKPFDRTAIETKLAEIGLVVADAPRATAIRG